MSWSPQRGSERQKVVLQWRKIPKRGNSPSYWYYQSVTLVGHSVYVAEARNRLWKLSCKTWRWEELGNRLLGIGKYHIAQLSAEKIYFYGGLGSPALVEYDTVLGKARKVETTGDSPYRRQYMSSVFAAWRSEIITFGGMFLDMHTRSNQTHALNVESKSWRKLELKGKRPKPRYLHTAAILGTKMYIYGGTNERSAPLDDLWIAELSQSLAPYWSQPQVNGTIPHARTGGSLNILKGMILLFGGDNRLNELRDFHLYFADSLTWCGESSQSVERKGEPPKVTIKSYGVTTATGVLYLTRSGIFLLSQE